MKLHILPSEFLRLERQDKAFVIAAIQLRVEAEEKAEKEIKHK